MKKVKSIIAVNDLIENAVNNLNKRLIEGEEIFGILSDDRIKSNNVINLSDITHKVDNINIVPDTNNVEVDITILDTPKGKIIQNLLNNNYHFCSEVICHDKFDKTQNAIIYDIERFDITLVNDENKENILK